MDALAALVFTIPVMVHIFHLIMYVDRINQLWLPKGPQDQCLGASLSQRHWVPLLPHESQVSDVQRKAPWLRLGAFFGPLESKKVKKCHHFWPDKIRSFLELQFNPWGFNPGSGEFWGWSGSQTCLGVDQVRRSLMKTQKRPDFCFKLAIGRKKTYGLNFSTMGFWGEHPLFQVPQNFRTCLEARQGETLVEEARLQRRAAVL